MGILSISNGKPASSLLTGDHFQLQLQGEIERARRSRRPVSLMLVELEVAADGASNGSRHDASARAAAALCAQKRMVDVAARISDSQLALVLPETDEAGALHVARRLRSEIARSLGDDSPCREVRLGVATFPRHGRNDAVLLQAAEQALTIGEDLEDAAPLLHAAELPAAVASVAPNGRTPSRRLGALLSLAETADVRARGQGGHSQRVARYAELIARELGLSEDAVATVTQAAVLHDIGNVAVPERVLRKTGPLELDEWKAMQDHPQAGAQVLEAAGLGALGECVLHHHERMDGSGYPLGLRASEIPLGARIISVADAFEAMTKDRPHRGAMPSAAAEQELADSSGIQFDRRVVDAFRRALARRSHPLPLSKV